MWVRWRELERASFMADVPREAASICSDAIKMMFAADLQWERFRAVLAAPHGSSPIGAPWIVEVHFFLVAADNARDRLAVWADRLDDDDARALAARLDNHDVKNFRHHQEHLEERMPGGKRSALAQLSAPGNSFVRVEGTGSIAFVNNLEGDQFLSFGQGRVDLIAAHSRILDVAGDLLKWLKSRSRLPRGHPVGAGWATAEADQS